ncbi:MAG TPA: hypothetical protein DEA22_03365 [Blastocatellia bacterium]|nr:hypothetical protein [Blastocatellia bacterium]
MKLIYLHVLLLSIALSVSLAEGQASAQKHPGIWLYEAGKFADAAASLKFAVRTPAFKTNAELWNYLGLAYLNDSNLKGARKSLETAVKLNPLKAAYRSNLAYAYYLQRKNGKSLSAIKKALELDARDVNAYHIRGLIYLHQGELNQAEADAESLLSIDPKYSKGYALKSDVLVEKFAAKAGRTNQYRENIDILKNAYDVLSLGVEYSKGQPDYASLEAKYETVGMFYDYFAKDKKDPAAGNGTPEPVVTPLNILVKPRAQYTDAARKANIQGSVKLLVILRSDGTVGPIMILAGQPYGLNDSGIAAARKIKFEPKTINGRPVSIVVTMEYSFSIY